MQIRRAILPKTVSDGCVTFFVIVMIPAVFWFELYMVLPEFHEVGSCMFYFHWIMATFLMFNVTSNYLAILFCDTSTKGKMLPSSLGPNWRFCSSCEATAPPRSWHCRICETCILKRDHHCMFTACCIGHFNLRYFYLFVFYIFISTLYSSIYNFMFLSTILSFESFLLFTTKIAFPLAMLFVEFSVNQLYIFMTVISAAFCVFSGALLCLHGPMMLKGQINFEDNHKIRIYDKGVKGNLREAFGDRWYLVWVSPFITSKLPSDGTKWETSKIK